MRCTKHVLRLHEYSLSHWCLLYGWSVVVAFPGHIYHFIYQTGSEKGGYPECEKFISAYNVREGDMQYVVVIPWVVCMYVEIIHEL